MCVYRVNPAVLGLLTHVQVTGAPGAEVNPGACGAGAGVHRRRRTQSQTAQTVTELSRKESVTGPCRPPQGGPLSSL